MDHHDQRFERNATNGYNVTDEIKAKVAIVTCANDGGRAHQKERVADRGCGYERRYTDCTSRTRTVFNDERLAESTRQPFTDQTRENIRGPARRKSDYDAHRPRWIIERPCRERYGGQAPAISSNNRLRASLMVMPPRYSSIFPDIIANIFMACLNA